MPILIVVALVLGAIAGLLVTKLPLEAMMLGLAGLVVAFVALSRPEFVILLLLMASSSVFDLGQIPTINVGFSFTAVELCLILLLGLVVVRVLGEREYDYVKTPLDLPIALFFLASFISLVNSVASLGTDVNQMEHQWRILFGYLTFFAVTNLVQTRRQLLTLVTGVFVIATVVAILMIAQQAVGTSVAFLPGRVETAGVFQSSFAGVTRILPPGQSLVLAMFVPVLVLFISRERPSWIDGLLFLSATLLLIGLAFTFNRSFWAGVAVSIAAVFLRTTREQRKNLVLFLCLIMVLGAIAIPLVSAYSAETGEIVDALYARTASLFDPNRAQSSASWQWRTRENEYAKIKIERYPFFGIGPGNDYRPKHSSEDNLTGYMHNTYLFILLDLGIVGFIPFVWFSVLFLVRAYLLWPTIRDRVFKAIVLGFASCYVAILVVGIAAPVFMTWYWTPVLGVMLGINEVIYKLDQRQSR
jgi:O-antigen ligase